MFLSETDGKLTLIGVTTLDFLPEKGQAKLEVESGLRLDEFYGALFL